MRRNTLELMRFAAKHGYPDAEVRREVGCAIDRRCMEKAWLNAYDAAAEGMWPHSCKIGRFEEVTVRYLGTVQDSEYVGREVEVVITYAPTLDAGYEGVRIDMEKWVGEWGSSRWGLAERSGRVSSPLSTLRSWLAKS